MCNGVPTTCGPAPVFVELPPDRLSTATTPATTRMATTAIGTTGLRRRVCCGASAAVAAVRGSGGNGAVGSPGAGGGRGAVRAPVGAGSVGVVAVGPLLGATWGVTDEASLAAVASAPHVGERMSGALAIA